jgi:transcription antitermination factor NusG
VSKEAAPWHALLVRSRHEQVVKTGLQGNGYEEFLPLYSSTSQWSDRVKLIERPLFPGYVFSRFDIQDRIHILQVPGVVGIVGNCRTPVDPEEIAAVQQLVASGVPITPWGFIQTNDKVLVQRGPFRGVEGIVVRLKQQQRLVVSISLLQRAVSVELDASCVVPAKPSWRERRPPQQDRAGTAA